MSLRTPIPRDGVYEKYWYFASERQAVFERRIAGEGSPWTKDKVLRTFKFCNVYRAADRVSQYLIKDVIYDGEDVVGVEDALFRIVAFRIFSHIDTWDGIKDFLGRQPSVADLRSGDFLRAIERVRSKNRTIYTAAFILCATDAYGYREKHRNHVALFKDMFLEGALPKSVKAARSMGDVFEAIKAYPLMGDFMSYQLAIDINYSEITDFSESSFVRPGPGALRGLKKVFVNLGDLSPDEAIMWMVDHQDEEFDRHGHGFPGLFGRPLQAIDCQGLFCEVDKYCREAVPWLTSSRTRIKQKFVPAGLPIKYFFPPKWAINDRAQDEGRRCRRAS